MLWWLRTRARVLKLKLEGELNRTWASRPVTCYEVLAKILRAAYSPQQICACKSSGESHGCDGESFDRHCKSIFRQTEFGVFVRLFLTVAPARSCI